MEAPEKKLVLIDGMALAYRGYFAMIRNPRITTTKLNTSAIYVFANVMIDLIQRERPSHFAVAFDKIFCQFAPVQCATHNNDTLS